MTLKKYDEIMEHIRVTPELRLRILERLQAAPPEHLSAPKLRRYLSLAACLALVVAGAAVLPRLFPSDTSEPPVIAAPGTEEVSSLAELSERVGFAVRAEFALPFSVESTSYCASWGTMAEVRYTGEGQTALFRQSPGREDNSGDYNSYPDIVEIDISGQTVTLRGDGGEYSLAVWTDGSYSYSLSLSLGVSAPAWQAVLSPTGE